jgi:two-component system heavy metal sensor histidine kinase CusS
VDAVPVELAELAESLNDMLARLEESFKRLSDFSSDLAHELRTPVSNLMTQTQVALSKTRSSTEYREVLESNCEEFERLSRMISDMLFLAKSENGLIVPGQESFDLADEVTALFDFYGALAEENGVTLRLEGSGLVTGDRLMLRRAIGNLLSNALRYTPLGAHCRDGQRRTRQCGRRTIHLAVENTGEPIPPEHLSRLFDRFYRVDASRRHSGDGAGLGLAITRSILRSHGGDIEGRTGKGSNIFEMWIPTLIVTPRSTD